MGSKVFLGPRLIDRLSIILSLAFSLWNSNRELKKVKGVH